MHEADPEGYPHLARIYPDTGHWMNRKDAEALPWMAKHTRNPWPKKVVWVQDDVTQTRFYWLAVPTEEAKARRKWIADVDGSFIRLSGDVPSGVTLRLSDWLVNLDQPVLVLVNGREVFAGVVPRRKEAIHRSLEERADPHSAATANIVLRW